MQVNSTFDYKAKALAALAASCFVTTASVHAGTTTSVRAGDQFRQASSGGSSDWQDAAADGHVFLYVEDAASALQPVHPRQTTGLEHLIASLRGMEHYKSNWDGEGAKVPVVDSLRAASNFACLLSQGTEIPEPLLHASGRAGLAWSGDGSYGELEFLENGSIVYYFAAGANKHKGIVTLDGGAIPVALEVLLPKA